jgi:hypothetical protein
MIQNDILFSEKQRFTQWWLWLLLLVINGIFATAMYEQVIMGQTFGDKPMSNSGVIVGFTLVLLVSILFYSFRLETIIKKDGIYVRFFPIHIGYRKYAWDKIEKVFVRQYNPITEYGGWGLRYGIFGAGKALNVSGNKGLQIIFKDNSKLLIGTKKSDLLKEVINKATTAL